MADTDKKDVRFMIWGARLVLFTPFARLAQESAERQGFDDLWTLIASVVGGAISVFAIEVIAAHASYQDKAP